MGSYAVLGLYYFTHIKNIYSLLAVCMAPEIVLCVGFEVENGVSTLKKFVDKL